jgi:hypothetical protein
MLHTRTKHGLMSPVSHIYTQDCQSVLLCRYLLRVLCPVRRPIAAEDYILLISAAGLGPEINFQARLWVLVRPCHNVMCWLITQHFIFLFIFCLEITKTGSSPTNLWTENTHARPHTCVRAHTPCELIGNFISMWCVINITKSFHLKFLSCFGSVITLSV